MVAAHWSPGAGLEPVSSGKQPQDTEEVVSSAGLCIGEAGDIVLLELEARQCFWCVCS